MPIKTVTRQLKNNKINIHVITAKDTDIISENDKEMDLRAKEAVKSAIHKSEICKKPIAKYDKEKKTGYVENPNGGRIYFGK